MVFWGWIYECADDTRFFRVFGGIFGGFFRGLECGLCLKMLLMMFYLNYSNF